MRFYNAGILICAFFAVGKKKDPQRWTKGEYTGIIEDIQDDSGWSKAPPAKTSENWEDTTEDWGCETTSWEEKPSGDERVIVDKTDQDSWPTVGGKGRNRDENSGNIDPISEKESMSTFGDSLDAVIDGMEAAEEAAGAGLMNSGKWSDENSGKNTDNSCSSDLSQNLDKSQTWSKSPGKDSKAKGNTESSSENLSNSWEESASGWSEGKSDMKQNTSGCDEGTSSLNQSTSALKQNTSGWGDGASGLKQNTSGWTESAAGLKQNTSGLNQSNSGLKQNSSAWSEGASSLKQNTSVLNQSTSGLKQNNSGWLEQPEVSDQWKAIGNSGNKPEPAPSEETGWGESSAMKRNSGSQWGTSWHGLSLTGTEIWDQSSTDEKGTGDKGSDWTSEDKKGNTDTGWDSIGQPEDAQDNWNSWSTAGSKRNKV